MIHRYRLGVSRRDCHAVMSRVRVAEAVTVDHKPSRNDEKDRIRAMIAWLLKLVFLEPGEDRNAFKGLAYKRDAPLYLEWAADNILSDDPNFINDKEKSCVVGEHETKQALLQQDLEGK
ncbi:hypothetical protein L2E82_11201 [Cichorium intybus]|uniref:Uncharacterized protein n=1 Tax=Cichorium intybus TaxID=13427 RepID=A0ACB9GDP3_CICIN|nr:hypothetical protein L2E82_11201 [Cichorium intybus]